MTKGDRISSRVPTFNWAELCGKTLEINVGRDTGYIVVMGKDVISGTMYVLHHAHEKEAE